MYADSTSPWQPESFQQYCDNGYNYSCYGLVPCNVAHLLRMQIISCIDGEDLISFRYPQVNDVEQFIGALTVQYSDQLYLNTSPITRITITTIPWRLIVHEMYTVTLAVTGVNVTS